MFNKPVTLLHIKNKIVKVFGVMASEIVAKDVECSSSIVTYIASVSPKLRRLDMAILFRTWLLNLISAGVTIKSNL